MVCYYNFLDKRNANGPVFNAGRFDPLTQKKLSDMLCYLLQQGRISQGNYKVTMHYTALELVLPPLLLLVLVISSLVI